MKVSACMIVKNEERCLARCLNSFKDIVDEIVVVDTGSTDRTVEIAESFGAKIYHFEWIGDFAAARNFSLEKASGDWILVLDADEFFRRGDDRKFLSILKEHHSIKKIDAVFVNRYEYQTTKHPDEEFMSGPDPYDSGNNADMRLFVTPRAIRNLPELRYIGRIHEAVINIKAIDKPVLMLPPASSVIVYHDGYSTGWEREKSKRNLELLKRAVQEGEQVERNSYYIGTTLLLEEGPSRSAMEYLRTYVMSDIKMIDFGPMGHIYLQACMDHCGEEISERLKVALHGVKQFPNHPTPYLLLADIQKGLYQYDEFIENYNKAISLKDNFSDTVVVKNSMLEEKYVTVFLELADVYLFKGECEKAALYYARSFQYQKKPMLSIADPNQAIINEMILKIRDKSRIAFKVESAEKFFACARRLPLKEAAQLIDIYFKPSNKDELEEIVGYLRRFCPNELFLIYFENYFKLTQKQDINFIFMLAAVGDFSNASERLMRRYAESGEELYLYKAIALAMIGGGQSLDSVYKKASERGRRIIDCFCRQHGHELIEEDAEACDVIAQDLVLLTDGGEKAMKFLRLTVDAFGVNASMRAAKILRTHHCNNQAIELCELAFDLPDEDTKMMKMKAADDLVRLYRISSNVKKTVEWTYKALENGNPPLLLREQIKWLLQTKASAPMKKELIMLKDEIDAFSKIVLPLDKMAPVKKETDKQAAELLERIRDHGENWHKAQRLFYEGEIKNRLGDAREAEKCHRMAFELHPKLGMLLLSSEKPGFSYEYTECDEPASYICPVCGGQSQPYQVFNMIVSEDYDRRWHPIRVWMKCETCRHLFARNFPEIERGEGPLYVNYFGNSGEGADPWASSVLENIRAFTDGKRLLKYGVGKGEFFEEIKKSGFDALMTDDDRKLAEHAQEKFALPYIGADFLAITTDRLFDIIIFDALLEIHPDAASIIKKAAELLCAGGVLWISTPDWESGYMRKHGDRAPLWRRCRHKNFFSAASLEILLKQAGLKIVSTVISPGRDGYLEVSAVKQ